MSETVPAERRRQIISAALEHRLLDAADAPLAAFMDLDGIAENVAALQRAFAESLPDGAGAQHAFAVKAHSEIPMLRYLHSLGMGCEVASEGELAQALRAGVAPERIVFDSPAKSVHELEWALSLGAAVNADNFQELDRITRIREELTPESASVIGIRVNPQAGVGAIAAMSTAGEHSKFGIPLRDSGNRAQLVDAYLERPWLSRLHAHIGSQGFPIELVVEGLNAVIDLAEEIDERAGERRVVSIDIGGGLAVDFAGEEPRTNWAGYAAALRQGAPRLFSGDYDLVTEFGRSVLAKFGFIAAYVEYTKEAGGRRIAITHAGAQVAMRTTFMPEAWPIRVEARNADGSPKIAPAEVHDVAGPCCFAGDLVARERELPRLDPGDIVTLLDTGAYYASTGFRYNSLLEPGIYGARSAEGGIAFETIRAPETLTALLARTPDDTASVETPDRSRVSTAGEAS
ncbi:diaminopimelate decarboxylase [Leucobacter sp. wl10]|uniref:diaminopimelate decarboxylase n=1 Tax=Leucobacter sp. wl10 TaxID=2304677 RepID=UPI0019694666|nr:diaminopimelate decarboxylase [Leucobacter sp. wl10]